MSNRKWRERFSLDVSSLTLRLRVPSPLAGEGQGEGAYGRARAVTAPHPNLPPQGGKEPTDVRLTKGFHPIISERRLSWPGSISLFLVTGISKCHPNAGPLGCPSSTVIARRAPSASPTVKMG